MDKLTMTLLVRLSVGMKSSNVSLCHCHSMQMKCAKHMYIFTIKQYFKGNVKGCKIPSQAAHKS